MTKQELFALFAEYDRRRSQACNIKDFFERADEIDVILMSLLDRLATAAKEK